MNEKDKNSQDYTTKSALIEFYTILRQYSLEINNTKKEESNLDYLSSMNELELIKYIKDSIDTVVLTLAEKKINEFNNQITCENIQQDYESMLVKYEQDIRGHIKVEHQLKLYSDSLQSNLEELEKEKKLGFNNNENNNNYIKEIQDLKKEINYQKKLIKSYEEQNIKSAENEKKLKNIIAKNEKKYKNEIDNLNKKINHYIEKLNILNNEKNEKRKSETISCYSSRRANNPHLVKNFMENEGNITSNQKMNYSLRGIGTIYRNPVNNISISDNHSTSMANSKSNVKIEKYILNKYIKNNKNKEIYLYQNKIKNIKNVSNLRSNSVHNHINIPNNNNNNSYILDSKAQDEIINKYMMNDSFMNTKKLYNRHKSVENNPNNYSKGKKMNIKKLLMQNENNTNKNSYSNKGFYNRSMINKKYSNNSGNNSINSEKNYMNKTTKEININNIIESKNNIGCNFVNNINIYSNNLKQDNGNNNIYIGNNIKKYTGNSSFREMLKNNNNINGTNYLNIHGNKNNMITYRNKQKEGKKISSISNSVKKKY